MRKTLKRRNVRQRQRGGDPLLFAATTQSIVNSIKEQPKSIYVPPHIEDPPCHPSILPEARKTGTCLEPADIEFLRVRWNEANPSMSLPPTNPGATRKRMAEVLRGRCTSEYCWINESFVGGEGARLRRKFRIAAPETWKEDPTTWLDSNNIYGYLKQLTEVHPWFETIYPSPIDFDKRIYDKVYNGECVVNELCNLNVERDLKKRGKTAYGVVFNLDPHNKPGSHWVALYINIEERDGLRPGAYYWDSYGIRAPSRIKTLMKRIQEQEGGPDKFILRENTMRHQKKGTECGMYSLYFITSLIEGRSFEDITKNIVYDDTINKFRSVYFAKGW